MQLSIVGLLVSCAMAMAQSSLRISPPQAFAKSAPPGVFKYPTSNVKAFAGASREPTPYNSEPVAQASIDYSMDRRSVAALLTAGAIGNVLGYPSDARAATSIPLITFDGAQGTSKQWTLIPKTRVLDTYGTLYMKGFVDPPEKKAKTEMIAYTIGRKAYPDVSKCEGISFMAKTLDAYEGYSISIGKQQTNVAPQSYLYKAKFEAPAGEFGEVKVPFKSFASPKGDTPDAATLQDIERVAFWAETGGTVSLSIGTISAYGCAGAAQLVAKADENVDGSTSFSWCLAAALLGLLLFFVMRTRKRPAPIAKPLLE
jgi:hypothetical protein